MGMVRSLIRCLHNRGSILEEGIDVAKLYPTMIVRVIMHHDKKSIIMSELRSILGEALDQLKENDINEYFSNVLVPPFDILRISPRLVGG